MKHATFILFWVLSLQVAKAQCPGTTLCESASVYCSAEVFNGFSCSTIAVPFPPPQGETLCFGVGVANNLMWWAFVGSGGPLTFTFEVDNENCSDISPGEGIQAGIFEGGCSGSSVFDCNASCNSEVFSLTGLTRSCEIYYLWVDGCNGAGCPFTITVSGNTEPPKINQPIPPLFTQDPVCPCGDFEVCVPTALECYSTAQWEVDGEEVARGDCAVIRVPDLAQAGDIIEVCVIVTIGNADDPNNICDQEIRCTEFVVESIPLSIGDTARICFEDQPYTWHGQVITSSCISPPCTARLEGPDGCCLDSIKAIILLPESAPEDIDTFLCSDDPLMLPNGDMIEGTACDSTIAYGGAEGCEQTLIVTVRRPNIEVSWTLDPVTKELCPEITREDQCGEMDTRALDLVVSVDGVTLDTLNEGDCITLEGDGEYKVEVSYKDEICDYQKASSTLIRGDSISPRTFQIAGQDSFCTGDSVLLMASGDFDTYCWPDGSEGPDYVVTEGGTVCVTGKMEDGSDEAQECFRVNEIFIELTSSDIVADNGGGTGAIRVEISTNAGPLTYQWSNGETTDFIFGLNAGRYLLEVTNAFGCRIFLDFEVPLNTSTQTEDITEVTLYPNPTDARLTILSDQSFDLYEIYDMTGRIIRNASYARQLEVSDLPPGVYRLGLFKDGQRQILEAFVKR